MLHHLNSHQIERPTGQGEDTRRRALAFMLARANPTPWRTRAAGVARDALTLCLLVAACAGLWQLLAEVIHP